MVGDLQVHAFQVLPLEFTLRKLTGMGFIDASPEW